MTIDAVAALAAQAQPTLDVVAPPTGTDLYKTIASSLEQLNSGLVSGQGAVRDLALGDMDNLHQLIMGMERTRLQFDLMMSVRGRLLEAYQEIMRMQI